nr:hypothetical protein [Tanacetum cinerariifolium]
MHNDIMAAGSKKRPPMLAPGSYAQWKSSQMHNDIMAAGSKKRPPMLAPETPKDGDRPRVPGYIEKGTYANTGLENMKLIYVEAEAIHMILNGIRNILYCGCLYKCEGNVDYIERL